MKILIAGSNEIWSIELLYNKYLNAIPGVNSKIVSTNQTLSKYNSFLTKIILFLKPDRNPLFNDYNKNLLSECQTFKPDILWVFKGMEVYPDTIKAIKNKGIRTANFNGDHPLSFLSRGSGNRNVLYSIPLFDIYLSYSDKIIAELKAKYNIKTAKISFGYEYPDNINLNFIGSKEIKKVCFIGNPDKIRVQTIEFILENGIYVDLYGNNWKRYLSERKYKNLKIFNPVYSFEFAKVVQSYRVHINIFRPHNIDAHNMRTFEIPSLGGIMLAPKSLDHQNFFLENKEGFFFENSTDLINKIQFIMNLSKSEVHDIRMRAINRSINSGYSYLNRAHEVYEIFYNLIHQ